MKDWIVTSIGHILPTDDLYKHIEEEDCWCKPRYDDGWLVHNSADKRELTENDPV